MARTLNEQEYAEKREEILAVAQRLVVTKGYEQMSIQDILDALQISKGAFYHYFESKPALLEALVDRIMHEIEPVLFPIVDDPNLPALDKMERLFGTAARWKAARKDYMLGLLKVWYADHNAIVRQKLEATGTRWIAPMLAKIIRQGSQEGTMQAADPEQVGMVTVTMMVSMGNNVAALLLMLSGESDPARRAQLIADMDSVVRAYTSAIERVMGVREGTLRLFDLELLKAWAIPAR